MNRMRMTVAAGALILAGMGSAAAQTVIVEGGYAPPAYVIAPAPVYTVPVAPAQVYVAPAPTYVAPAVPVRRWHREVGVTETPAWTVAPGAYSDW